MRHTHHFPLFAAIIFLVFTVLSCDKMPDDTELDGMWQLASMEKNGAVTNKKDDMAFWSFRLKLCQLSTTDNNPFFAHFVHNGDSLILTDLCHNSKNETSADNNEWITTDEPDLLLRWGVYPVADENKPGRVKAAYHIDELTSSRMVLRDNACTLTFNKY